MGKIGEFCLGLFKNIITLNGKIVGRNVNQVSFGNNNSQIIIDGKSINLEGKEINVTVTGNINSVQLGVGKIDIHGSVMTKVKTGAGDVTIMQDVIGDVETGAGKISIGGSLQGDVKTGSGDVICASFEGDFKSGSGSIKLKK